MVAVVAGSLGLAGCFAALRVEGEGKRFDHSHHVKRGLDCLDCHGEARTKARASMPGAESCSDCHGTTDEPSVAAVVSGYLEQRPEARHSRPKTYEDVTFDHSKHVAKNVACDACHKGAKEQALPNPSGPMTMATCLSCHKEKGGPREDCKSCHETLGRDVKPASHKGPWERQHGFNARLALDNVAVATTERCDLCHARSACDDCHLKDPPKSHTEAWRTATHGMAAAMDRSRCQACHQADSCDRCHRTQPPHSHLSGSFGAPRDGHCLTCHEPLSGSACAVCHKGTPRHQQAPPKPAVPPHNPGLNCRQCHGAGQPLPHVDNGTECNACHH